MYFFNYFLVFPILLLRRLCRYSFFGSVCVCCCLISVCQLFFVVCAFGFFIVYTLLVFGVLELGGYF